MVFGLLWLLAHSGLELRRAPRVLMSDSETAIAVVREACLHPRPGVYLMSGIICSQGASAVHKGEFRNVFNIGVAKVYTLKQSATVTRMRSNSCKMLRESECGDFRRAKTARCQLTGPSLQC